MKTLLLISSLALYASMASAAELEADFANPPVASRVHAYWWWLNGNVTKAAITRDLEQMKAKGMGGAVLFDAGGATQDGHRPVPAGPTFFTPEWRELFKHTVREGDRLGLEISLNLQSGWNLGGPIVRPEEASKILTWSEMRVRGPAKLDEVLPKPKTNAGFYRDIAILAYPLRAAGTTRNSPFAEISASSSQDAHLASDAIDGKADTFWVSGGATTAGAGPSRKNPQWLQLNFTSPVAMTGASVLGRPGYGPRECELQVWADGKGFRTVKAFTVEDRREARVSFEEVQASRFRLLILGSYDRGVAESPRNVQVAEFRLMGKGRTWPTAVRAPIQLFQAKASYTEYGWAAPDCTPLLEDLPDTPGEEDCRSKELVDLTGRMRADGQLRWDVPEGSWQILRVGYTASGAKVSTSSDGWKGLAIDYLDPNALKSYWKQIVGPLIADAGPLAGRSLKYLHTDSWELGGANWTGNFAEEFRKRRGYDLRRYLPALAGKIVDSRSITNRFLFDFRKTIGDCIADNHYGLMAEMAHEYGIGIHPESGGPHAAPIDALKCLGRDDNPMSEFWARSYRHRVKDTDRFFVKQAATAAHIYGKRYVWAEGFTNIGLQWEESLWENLKPTFDHEICQGLNVLVWHTFTCSPEEMGKPGQEYFAGTHFNPNVTWWNQSQAFLSYLNRCQSLMSQGLFVADVCYYYGDQVPNFTQLKESDPAKVLPGYDYDVVNEEVILNRMSVKDGRLVLPDGMSYRIMVLQPRQAISLAVLRKLAEFVKAGATVIGPKPTQATGLADYPNCDAEVEKLADAMWGKCDGRTVRQNAFGQGRVIWGRTAREVLAADGIAPDFEVLSAPAGASIDYIHRSVGDAQIYFVCNQQARPQEVRCAFRVSGKAPELWLADSGEIHRQPIYAIEGGRTVVPLHFEANGSVFVVFRSPAGVRVTSVSKDDRPLSDVDLRYGQGESLVLRTLEAGRYRITDSQGRSTMVSVPALPDARVVDGPWTVAFPRGWGAPESATFDVLKSWTANADFGIRHFSGTATYAKQIEIPEVFIGPGKRVVLDLGQVREIAEVRLNGRDLGVLWKPPFQADVTAAARAGSNALEVRVTNFWPNRLIGDLALPAEKRLTRTNITKFKKDSPLMPSGLLGPVRMIVVGEQPISFR